jgi:hypothetical protein
VEERQLFDRNKLLQQLHSVQSDSLVHEVHHEQPIQTAHDEHHATATHDWQGTILKGLSAGVDIYSLFLFACSGLAELTGDTDFRDQAGELVRIVYDEAQELTTLPVILDGIHLRGRRLENYLSRSDISPEARATAEQALIAHRREAEKIRQKILS